MHYTYAMNEQPPMYEPAPIVPPTFPQPPEPTPKPPTKRRTILIIVIAAIVVIIAACAVLFLLLSKKQSTQATATTSAQGIRTAPHNASFEQAYARVAAKYDIPGFAADKKASLLAAYDDLSNGFALNANALDDDTTIMHALGIASMYTSDTANRERYRTELYLLFVNDLASVPSGINDSTFEGSDYQKTVDILQKYQSTDLTKRVEQSSVLQGALDNAVSILKLGSRNKLSPYKIIAFDFDTTDPQFDQLTKQHSLYGARPNMWTENLGGTFYIMMFKSYAEGVINGTAGSLPHEFIHAQSAFVRGEAGRMIEERRAELFSGDHSAYYDAKQLAIYLNVFAGIDVYSFMQANPTDSAKLYAMLYKQLGVPGTNALVFSWPNVYEGTDSNALKSIYALDNQDIALQQALSIGKQDMNALTTRVKQRYDKLIAVLNTKDKVISDLSQNLGQNYRMPTGARYMTEYAKSR